MPNDPRDEKTPLPRPVGEDGLVQTREDDRTAGDERDGDDKGAHGGDLPDGGLAETGSGKDDARKIV